MVSARYTTQLTEFERQVLFLIMSGRKHNVIASELGCRHGRVKSAATRIYDKLGASNKVEAVNMAIAQGVFSTQFGYWGA